jgi:hypothetical protein
MATTEETLDQFEQKRVCLRRQIADLEERRRSAIDDQDALNAIDADMALARRKLRYVDRYLQWHPDA